ncbi:hypothetical protein ACFHWD_16785 [Clostridium sp. MT-14]|uniref:hypothetical protein n=1 Tax=Clostridium sp. MT-14 TaxID=3348360 RepID=UPI0035F2E34A
MEQVTEIPLKKVTAAQVIKNHYTALTVKIDGNIYIGTEFFFLREDLATSGYINRHKKLSKRRELKEDTFKDLSDIDSYKCSENSKFHFLDATHKIIVLETEIGDIAINYNYYSYFKKRNLELKFNAEIGPIGMFTATKFAGIVLPYRLKVGDEN